jgi:hypothetical protein
LEKLMRSLLFFIVFTRRFHEPLQFFNSTAAVGVVFWLCARLHQQTRNLVVGEANAHAYLYTNNGGNG